MDWLLSRKGLIKLLVLTVAISLAIALYLFVLAEVQDSIWDSHSCVNETDPPDSPFRTAELIDDILASDERVQPILAENHTPPGGIFSMNGTSTIYMQAYYRNGTIEKFRITVDTPARTVVAVEPVETFPDWCYATVVSEESHGIP